MRPLDVSMKNTAIADEANDAGWGDALRLFDADLRRRGAADKTRRAYATDLGQLGEVRPVGPPGSLGRAVATQVGVEEPQGVGP